MTKNHRFFDVDNHREEADVVIVHMDMDDRVMFPQLDKILFKMLDRIDLSAKETFHYDRNRCLKVELDIRVADDVIGEPRVLAEHSTEPAAKSVGVTFDVLVDGNDRPVIDIYDHEGDRYPVKIGLAIADYDWEGEIAVLDKCNYVRQAHFSVTPATIEDAGYDKRYTVKG